MKTSGPNPTVMHVSQLIVVWESVLGFPRVSSDLIEMENGDLFPTTELRWFDTEGAEVVSVEIVQGTIVSYNGKMQDKSKTTALWVYDADYNNLTPEESPCVMPGKWDHATVTYFRG